MLNSTASAKRERNEAIPTRRTIRGVMFTAEARRGHARYTRELLTALASETEMELVTSEDLTDEFRTNLYPIHAILPRLVPRSAFRTTLGWGAARLSYYWRREATFLKWLGTRPDVNVVHVQEYTPWLAPGHFRKLRRRGVAVVMTVHNIANYGHSSRSYMRAMRSQWPSAWRACSALIVHTEGLRDELSRILGPDGPPIFVTAHAVWEERRTPPRPINPPRPGGPARLLFFGVIRRNKGVSVLLDAMEKLPNCTLTIAGEPESAASLEAIRERIRALPAGQVEIVPGYIDETDIAGYFDRSHLVILPYTEFAAQSGVLHQAVGHGRPVVVSDVGGLGESVRAWGIGEVVPPSDAPSLAKGIERALDPGRHRAASGATDRVRGGLTWTRMAEATLDVYRAAAGETSSP